MITKNSTSVPSYLKHNFDPSYLNIFLLEIQGIYKKVLHIYYIETSL